MSLLLVAAALAAPCTEPVSAADVAQAAFVASQARVGMTSRLRETRVALGRAIPCVDGPLGPMDAELIHAALDPAPRAVPELAAVADPGTRPTGRFPEAPRGGEARVDGFAGLGLHGDGPALVQVLDADGRPVVTHWADADDVARFLAGGDLLSAPVVERPAEVARRRALAAGGTLGLGVASIATSRQLRAAWVDPDNPAVETREDLDRLGGLTRATWWGGWALTGAGLVSVGVLLVVELP